MKQLSVKAEALAATLVHREDPLQRHAPLYVSAAYGITHLMALAIRRRSALARADEAMYADKALHRRAQA